VNLYSQLVESGELVLAGSRFPAVWLRDNCPCPCCTDPGSGQRLVDVLDIPNGVTVSAARPLDDSAVLVTYQPDGHQSEFSLDWLAAHAPDGYGPGDPRTADGKQLWRAADLDGRIPVWTWQRYLDDREPALESVLRVGFALLREVPVQPGTVTEVAETFGFVRETNYGRIFDVRVEPDPENLANSAREITPHTDNPYRDPVPTIQLLHCLSNAAGGGHTGLVDGFAVAELLRQSHPDEFEVLTSTPRTFWYSGGGTELRTSQPLIHLDPRGRIRGVRFNNRSAGPLRAPHDEVERYYRAYRRWTRLLWDEQARLTLRMEPGDCLIFDNTRILHARTAFTDVSERHLQGCYADLDGLESTMEVFRCSKN
jgi:gamma-butyrobetaine dioxygenase